jgi:hypothetical protein
VWRDFGARPLNKTSRQARLSRLGDTDAQSSKRNLSTRNLNP